MNKVVLVTGAGGFVGQSVLRLAYQFQELTIVPLARDDAAKRIRNARNRSQDSEISLLNLAWPSLQKYSALADLRQDSEYEWRSYEQWLDEIINSAAKSDIRFFQIGSGIERYANTNPPSISDPYLGYARRKESTWRRVKATMPATSWKLSLHFIFGPGESRHRVVPSAIRACQGGTPITVGEPARRRCWLQVDDAARGLLSAASSSVPEDWDICGTDAISFDQLFKLVGEATGSTAIIKLSDAAVADADCPLVAPVNPAPFIRPGAGDPGDLLSRLIEYARFLAR